VCIYPMTKNINLIQSKKVCFRRLFQRREGVQVLGSNFVISRDTMLDEQSMMPQTIETYVPVLDGAFPSSVDVHVNFEQLAMIHYRA